MHVMMMSLLNLHRHQLRPTDMRQAVLTLMLSAAAARHIIHNTNRTAGESTRTQRECEREINGTILCV